MLAFGAHYLARDFLVLGRGYALNDYVWLGRDFVNVWHGGGLARDGQAGLLYDIDGYRASLAAATGLKGIYAYSYPPHSLFLAVPFSLLPYGAALAVWTLLGLGLFAHAARPYLERAGLPWWLGLLLPAGFVNIWAAHYGFLIGALALYGWRALACGRPALAGLAFALMTVKPHLGLLIALALLLRGAWKAIGWTLVLTLILVAVSALLFGPDLWRTYITSTLGFHARLLDAPEMAFHMMMPTTTMAGRVLGWAPGLSLAAQIITALLAAGLVAWAAWRKVAVMDLGLLAGTAIFLVLPYAFNYDMTVQCLAALVFAARADSLRAQLVLCVAFLLPLLQMSLANGGVPIAPLVLLAALIEQARIAGVFSGRAAPEAAAAAHSA